MNNSVQNGYCIVSENEMVNLDLLDTYLYLVKMEESLLLKIWYKDLFTGETRMVSVRCNEGRISSCINAIETLVCKDGIIGLDYSDAFQYMSGESGNACFSEYSIRQEGDVLIVEDIDDAKAICKTAKRVVALIDGWYTLLEAQEVVNLLDVDDVEIAYQVHADEGKKDGKLYIWISGQ